MIGWIIAAGVIGFVLGFIAAAYMAALSEVRRELKDSIK